MFKMRLKTSFLGIMQEENEPGIFWPALQYNNILIYYNLILKFCFYKTKGTKNLKVQ